MRRSRGGPPLLFEIAGLDLQQGAGVAESQSPGARYLPAGSKEAGEKLIEMLELGMSQPWPETLAVLTGQGEMDATAILDYFVPLKGWLDGENEGRTCGW